MASGYSPKKCPPYPWGLSSHCFLCCYCVEFFPFVCYFLVYFWFCLRLWCGLKLDLRFALTSPVFVAQPELCPLFRDFCSPPHTCKNVTLITLCCYLVFCFFFFGFLAFIWSCFVARFNCPCSSWQQFCFWFWLFFIRYCRIFRRATNPQQAETWKKKRKQKHFVFMTAKHERGTSNTMRTMCEISHVVINSNKMLPKNLSQRGKQFPNWGNSNCKL